MGGECDMHVEKTNACRDYFVGKSEGRRLLGSHRHIWALVNMVMNIQVL
jgi:hypothetical protein